MKHLAATEIVRRAERCIGLAIRKGQDEGKVRRRGQIKSTPRVDVVVTRDLPSPTDFASRQELHSSGGEPGIYSLTDNVTDAQFDEAIETGTQIGQLTYLQRNRKPACSGRPGTLPLWLRSTETIC